ncbi:hypothetical protein GDO86_015673 [Hymenochirus boettgeri]|uniref:Uncharacterized protein n=1 Tax=Hymenochirus boettgeri TaxID=247094 RepID=A0A8T2K203_9PIPI|nr:hypothetical protein GDO86_015673 [Hymenochirus boettgeri]
MSLCVRKIRVTHGIGSRWRNGVQGAVTGRVRAEQRLQEIGWLPEMNPSIVYPSLFKTPLPPATTITFSCSRPSRVRLYPSVNGWEKHQKHQRSTLVLQRTKTLSQKTLSKNIPFAIVESINSMDRDIGHLNSTQLECFRGLFEPGVCRTPYQAMALPIPGSKQGVLAFHPSMKIEASPMPGDNNPDMEQHLALMHAKLREELPKFLLKSLDYSIYRKDVEFLSSILGIHTRGIILYQLLLTVSRFLFLSYYSNSHISVLKLTSHPETCSIQARWSISGLPLHSLLFNFYRTDKVELYKSYDAYSTFYLASDGLIRLHKLEQVMPSQPIAVPKKTILTAALVALGLGEDRPALHLLSSPKAPAKP